MKQGRVTRPEEQSRKSWESRLGGRVDKGTSREDRGRAKSGIQEKMQARGKVCGGWGGGERGRGVDRSGTPLGG